MGILDGIFGAQRQAAPSLVAVFVAPPVGDQAEQTRAARALAQESDAILALLASTDETCLAAACATDTEPVVVIVTDQRTLTIKRGRIRQEMRHADVADVALGTFTNDGVLVTIEPKSPGGSMRPERAMQLRVASPKIGGAIRSHIWRQEQGAGEHSLPRDIIPLMERFGHMQFDPQGHGAETEDIWLQLACLVMPFAQADPSGFLTALAEAVLPVGGWAVYGAERMMWELLSSPPREHPAYTALMDASIAFLRANGVSPMRVTGYEWQYWIASGGTNLTWLPLRPMPSPEQAPITPLGPGETRRVTQLTSNPDSNEILVRQNADGHYCALIDARKSDEDPRRVRSEWKFADSLPEIYRAIGMALQTSPYWCDRELEPYFPLPRPQI